MLLPGHCEEVNDHEVEGDEVGGITGISVHTFLEGGGKGRSQNPGKKVGMMVDLEEEVKERPLAECCRQAM